ncbi:hypothetical protein PACTADRAFT_73669 [Pachysolen tannophilus NRRL Y-2460]|uniref:UDP-N-acetylglucosamine diphosphorylase n=1 Tax=Pachysolen tannophilus NRRL Y-2460 TaxID=669874 RepID=A0A1E4U1Z9_PACTA|nr:hypothetical protein PACTADRAFT_73669 [Pachysolen tannophilus NRRL Y-2460]
MPSSLTADIKQQYIDANQEHLFAYWDELSLEEQSEFLSQLSQFEDPLELVSTVQKAINFSKSNCSMARNFKPLPVQSHSSLLEEPAENVAQWEREGLELINRGEVGVILMAGGQGSRLGSCAPKGCYDIGLPSHKSLFQIQAEKIMRVVKLSNETFHNNNARVTWYIMTSIATRKITENYFIDNNYFGLNKNHIIFFNQGTFPCFSIDGSKILLNSKNSICESPDGNGGLYKGIYSSKLLEDFDQKNIKHIHMYCVDNCLARVADPTFIGWSARNKYDLSTKVVRKRNASEKVGLIVLDTDRNCPCVIEYSEISKELSEKQDENGNLYLKAANIVNHYYSVDLLKKEIPKWIKSQEFLPFHIAKKKVSVLNPQNPNTKITPIEPNAIKLEQFIFDVFPSIPLSKFGCLEVDRHEEFSPLKNGPEIPIDSPQSARLDSLKLGTKWILQNGGKLDNENSLVEVSSLTSYKGEDLEFVKGKTYKDGDIV